MVFIRRHRALIIYLVIGALVVNPSLRRGYLFLLDMPWPEHFYLANYTRNGIPPHFPLLVIFWALNKVIAGWVLQRALLSLLIGLAGYGMHRLVKSLGVDGYRPYVGGLIYAVNPFILDRLLAGQWLVMLGYTMLPIVLYYLIKVRRSPTIPNLALLLGSTVLLAMSAHYMYMLLLLAMPVIGLLLFKKRIQLTAAIKARRYLLIPLAAVSVLFGINAAHVLEKTSSLPPGGFEAFATRGSFLEVLTLRGFWYSDGLVPVASAALWVIFCFGCIAISTFGLYRLYKKSPGFAVLLAMTMVAVTVLAVGYGNPTSAELTKQIVKFVPSYSGMRDTQKWVGLIAFAYAAGVSLGSQELKNSRYKPAKYLLQASAFVLLVGLLSSVGTLTHIRTKLQPYSYPTGWMEANRYLEALNPDRVIALPWRAYLKLDFANNVYMANPARIYFNANIVSRSGSANPALSNPISEEDRLILSLSQTSSSLPQIKMLNADYVLVMKVAGYEVYADSLATSNGKLVLDNESVSIYQLNGL